MSRRMSFSLTPDQILDGSKTVTRRHPDTWKNLKPGEEIVAIRKGMGLPKGAKQEVLRHLECVGNRVEPISLLTDDIRYGRQEVALEGLGRMTPDEFVDFWCKSHGMPTPAACFRVGMPRDMWTKCRRIEFRYLDEGES